MSNYLINFLTSSNPISSKRCLDLGCCIVSHSNLVFTHLSRSNSSKESLNNKRCGCLRYHFSKKDRIIIQIYLFSRIVFATLRKKTRRSGRNCFRNRYPNGRWASIAIPLNTLWIFLAALLLTCPLFVVFNRANRGLHHSAMVFTAFSISIILNSICINQCTFKFSIISIRKWRLFENLPCSISLPSCLYHFSSMT